MEARYYPSEVLIYCVVTLNLHNERIILPGRLYGFPLFIRLMF
jgi:hypothetical protein